MTAIVLLPLIGSAAVGAAAFLGLRPLVAAYCLPAVIGAAWVLA